VQWLNLAKFSILASLQLIECRLAWLLLPLLVIRRQQPRLSPARVLRSMLLWLYLLSMHLAM